MLEQIKPLKPCEIPHNRPEIILTKKLNEIINVVNELIEVHNTPSIADIMNTKFGGDEPEFVKENEKIAKIKADALKVKECPYCTLVQAIDSEVCPECKWNFKGCLPEHMKKHYPKSYPEES